MDMENFADLLDLAVIDLKEARRSTEICLKLQMKMTEPVLTRYHSCIEHYTIKGYVRKVLTTEGQPIVRLLLLLFPMSLHS